MDVTLPVWGLVLVFALGAIPFFVLFRKYVLAENVWEKRERELTELTMRQSEGQKYYYEQLLKGYISFVEGIFEEQSDDYRLSTKEKYKVDFIYNLLEIPEITRVLKIYCFKDLKEGRGPIYKEPPIDKMYPNSFPCKCLLATRLVADFEEIQSRLEENNEE